ncbi:calcium-binding protein [Roseomonas sp. JC162]|uniref:Calcium-binding protein n=1 Tax=Neoroseomonas marina TaxID=1232220 RepID=A0A848EFK4_9PROT|nr:calcium-binding protein [Neoroseomonas marina]NMJ43414.1 calcium-binding protein [Neoroseomonas marina]
MADFATLPGGQIFGTNGSDLVDADRDAPGSFDNLIATFGGSDTVFAGQGDDIVFGGDEARRGRPGRDDDDHGRGHGKDRDDHPGRGHENGQGHGKGQGHGPDNGHGHGPGHGDGAGPPSGDYLFGQDGNDVLFGGRGDDLLDGGADNDVLIGGQGNDLLFGGAGSDFLAGNAGADTLVGGTGEDTFYFESGFGRDVVLDFRPGEDVIAIQANINGSGITSAQDLVGRISSDDTGAVISLGDGDQIKLVGVSTEDLLSNLSSYVKIV